MKKKRGRPPKPGGPTLQPPKPQFARTGPALMQHIAEVTESSLPEYAPPMPPAPDSRIHPWEHFVRVSALPLSAVEMPSG